MGERYYKKRVQKIHLDESQQSTEGAILAVTKAVPTGAAQ